MKILEVAQGSPEWLAARAQYHCASDAPVMMGVSKHMKRGDLVRMLATGDERQVSAWVQENLLAKGHDVEEPARKMVEEIVGEDLYPVVGVDDSDKYLASFDGLTMAGDTIWEGKLWNEELAALVRAGVVPETHTPQLDQQLMVCETAERVIFSVSDGKDRFVHCEYKPDPAKFALLRAGWAQLKEDAANYQHVEVIPAAVAAPVKDLPVLDVQVSGVPMVRSNLDAFGAKMREYIAAINMKPEDDQAFADAEAAIKEMEKAESALAAALDRALAQTGSIDDLRRTVTELSETARSTRLALEKQVKAQKENVRAAILKSGQDRLAEHIAGLNKRIGVALMPTIAADFAGAMKGKRTVASLRESVDTTLAHAKIAANQTADRIHLNLAVVRSVKHQHLFPDVAQIVLKSPEDLETLVRLRITEHEAAEQKRQDEERAKIRAEEEARAAAASLAAARAAEPAVASAPVVAAYGGEAAVHARQAENRFFREPAVNVAPASPKPTAPAPWNDMPAGATDQFTDERPTDGQIIGVLAKSFGVHESRVIGWLLDLDLEGASERLARAEGGESAAPAEKPAVGYGPIMVAVVSSQIKAIGYKPDTKVLAIQFNTGAIYDYFQVPANVAHALVTAKSIGSFFTSQIKNGGFSYKKREELVKAA